MGFISQPVADNENSVIYFPELRWKETGFELRAKFIDFACFRWGWGGHEDEGKSTNEWARPEIRWTCSPRGDPTRKCFVEPRAESRMTPNLSLPIIAKNEPLANRRSFFPVFFIFEGVGEGKRTESSQAAKLIGAFLSRILAEAERIAKY